MSSNNRVDRNPREHFGSMDDYVKRGSGLNRVNIPKESPFTFPMLHPPPTLSGSVSMYPAYQPIASEFPFVPGGSGKNEYPYTSTFMGSYGGNGAKNPKESPWGAVACPPTFFPPPPPPSHSGSASMYGTYQSIESEIPFVPGSSRKDEYPHTSTFMGSYGGNGAWPVASPPSFFAPPPTHPRCASKYGTYQPIASEIPFVPGGSSKDEYPHTSTFMGSYGGNGANNPKESPWGAVTSPPSFFPPPPPPIHSRSASVDKRHQPLPECPFVPTGYPKNEYPLEKTLTTCQVPIMSKGNASAGALAGKAFDDSQIEQYKMIKDLVMDEESDKRDLISAMESVLNTLKVYEAKKQEASTAKAQDAGYVAAESSWKQWVKMMSIHLQLEQAAKKNKASLTAKASRIQTRFLHLLRDQRKIFNVLDDMRGNLDSQLAQVEKDISKSWEMKLQQKHLSLVEHNVKMLEENNRALSVKAKRNKELKDLLADYDYQVEVLKNYLVTTKDTTILVKKEFEKRIRTLMVKRDTPSKTRVALDSSISSHDSDDSTQLETYEHSVSSEDTEGSELSSYSSEGESGASDESEALSAESEDSASESDASEESEDSESESEASDESEDSASESEALSAESDDSGQAKASDMEVSPAVTSQILTVRSLADPSVASITTVTEQEHHELPNETETQSDDDWDFCGLSDSEA